MVDQKKDINASEDKNESNAQDQVQRRRQERRLKRTWLVGIRRWFNSKIHMPTVPASASESDKGWEYQPGSDSDPEIVIGADTSTDTQYFFDKEVH